MNFLKFLKRLHKSEIQNIIDERIKYENLNCSSEALNLIYKDGIRLGLQSVFKKLSFIKEITNNIDEELLQSINF